MCCIKTLEKSVRRSPASEQAMKRAYADLTRLECDPPHAGVGGWQRRGIFQGVARCAAPMERPKSTPNSGELAPDRVADVIVQIGRQPERRASHQPMLNYAYGILESQVRVKTVAEGYHPRLGIMHESREGSPAFVFDIMEPERPKVDRSILEFVKSHKFRAADFVIRVDGVCRLTPAMAKRGIGSGGLEDLLGIGCDRSSMAE
jgi:CRISP-associated protein Cas1